MTRGMCHMYAPIRRVVYMYFYCTAQTKKSFLDDQINLSHWVKVMEDNLACPQMEAPHASEFQYIGQPPRAWYCVMFEYQYNVQL